MTTAIEDAIAALKPFARHDGRESHRAAAKALARLTAEQARFAPGHTDLMVPPETLDAWLDANPLPVPADGWTAGAEAMREACAIAAATWLEKQQPYGTDTRRASIGTAAAIRAISIPSPPAEEKTP